MSYIINKKDYSNEVNSLVNFAQNRMGFSQKPKVSFSNDPENAGKTLGKTAYYDPNSAEIRIFVTGRHIKDILRSIAHELVHHVQNENGDLNNDGYMGQGYAQKNPKMREMERQAYEKGNLCFRDWEDSLKEKHPTIYNERRNHKMSLKDWKNKELNENLNNRWGFGMNLDKLNESEQGEEDGEEMKEDKMPMKDEPEGEDLNDDGKEGEGKVPEFLDEAEDKDETEEEAELTERSKIKESLTRKIRVKFKQ